MYCLLIENQIITVWDVYITLKYLYSNMVVIEFEVKSLTTVLDIINIIDY